MSKRECDAEPIDASWQSAPWKNDGETIEAYDSDGSGDIMTIDWPENATDPELLNEKQRQMIRTAVKYPDLESPSKLIRHSGLDVSKHYPKHVLRRHWPERYWGKTPEKEGSGKSRAKVPASIESLRKRALAGESAKEIAQSLGVSSQPIQRRLKGSREFSDGWAEDCDIPPLEYDPKVNSWQIADSEDVDDRNEHTKHKRSEYTTPKDNTSGVVSFIAGLIIGWVVSKLLD